ncbi:phage portal protein [Ornithinibacillus sp. JPR2-1]|uniref:phage portal protein n=1 Tax=Ornithinibacillus sp. JPR2-1 TaxID=2094019 RepID=UPI0031DC4FF7
METTIVKTNPFQRFSDEANMHYTYSSAADLVENKEALMNMINHHESNQRPRLKELQDYYEGNNTTVLQDRRRREEHLSDHRATHPFAEYVSDFIQGFMVGIPLKTEYKDKDINETIRNINRTNDADEHNSDLVLDQSIYGRAYELLYRNHQDEIRFTKLDVMETFVVYDDTVEKLPIAGVRYFRNQFSDEKIVIVYTSDSIHEFKIDNEGKLTEQKESKHAFGGVPIIEYSNNRFRRGDFEKVLSLIDLYDEAQSDTANYMTDLNDAMLKIIGNLDLDVDEAKDMKEKNILFLKIEPSANGQQQQADADYIYKKYDVQGTESYKDRVKNDTHMFTATPNMDDQHFASNQSGEAMKYKLFALEQKRATKERLFKKSLRNRYRLVNNIMTLAAEGSFNVNDLSITFTPNLPKSLKDEIEAFTKLGGDLSDETKLKLLSIVENPSEELERMREEIKRRRPSTYDFQNNQSESDEEVTPDG